MYKAIPVLGALLAAAAPACARDWSGFFTPESVKDRRPPYVPVSTTAALHIGTTIVGRLRFRELGEYRVEGRTSGSDVELTLYDGPGAPAGRGRGMIAATRLDVMLELFGPGAEVRTRGRLSLEAGAEWRASPVVKEGKRVADRARLPWFHPEFDDSSWDEIELPDDNAFGDDVKHARYYRSRFRIDDPTVALSAVFSSDDGIWIYCNGAAVGHWGAQENRPGCVNDPLERCGINGTVPPVEIPRALLREGENVIAVKVNNGDCCFTYFNLLLQRVSARFIPEVP